MKDAVLGPNGWECDPSRGPYKVYADVDPVTGGLEKLVVSGSEANMARPISKAVIDARGGVDFITTKSTNLWDWAQQTALPTLTTCAAAVDPLITRWGGATLAVTPSAATSQFRQTSISISLDPVDQLGSIDVFIPIVVAGSDALTITLHNVNYSANYTTWGWNLNALRQGWNTLKFWCGDTTASATTPPSGTLGWGCSKAVGGTGFDPSAPATHVEVNITGFNGTQLNFGAVRKGGKSKPCVIFGWDSTGFNAADTIFTRAGGVADFLSTKGIRAYFASTALWDLFSNTTTDQARKDVLYKTYGWDCLPHFWNHGASMPGTVFTASGAVSRAGNVVTINTTVPLSTGFKTAVTAGMKWYGMVSGGTDTTFNGLAYMTATGASQITYANTGADASAGGTVTFSTKQDAVISADDATRRAIMRHELVDLVRLLRARGWNRGLNIGAYPTNTVGCMEVMQPICAEAGIKYFRGIKKTTTAVTEFGVDNPLHFGSIEMGSDSSSPTLPQVIASLQGAIGRGEHLWTYGHYVLDETDPANIAHAGANLDYGPGQGGNPSAPSVGGWWYFGTLKKFVNETVLPLVAAGTVVVMSPSEWASSLGNIDGSR